MRIFLYVFAGLSITHTKTLDERQIHVFRFHLSIHTRNGTFSKRCLFKRKNRVKSCSKLKPPFSSAFSFILVWTIGEYLVRYIQLLHSRNFITAYRKKRKKTYFLIRVMPCLFFDILNVTIMKPRQIFKQKFLIKGGGLRKGNLYIMRQEKEDLQIKA